MARPRPPGGARPRHVLAESRSRPWVLAVTRALGPAYMRLALGFRSVEFRHPERIVEAWRDAQENRSRLILAFRHPYGDEPQLLSFAFDLLVTRAARSMGRPLPRRPHARFVHGYEVPLWSGTLVRWILPRVGAVPVYHVKFDSSSVGRLRKILLDDPDPLALAPEGQVSYRSETLPRLENGAARLAFWCAGDLERAGRSEDVVVLPVSVHYRYDERDTGKLDRLVAGTELSCGIVPGRGSMEERLRSLELRLLELAEALYGIRPDAPEVRAGWKESRNARMDSPAGSADRIVRVYRIRQEGWNRIYPEGDLASLSPLERELADRRACEAWYAMRHMELVDLAHYLDADYLDRPSAGRLVETAYSLADFASRLTGGDISHRPDILGKRAYLYVAEPLALGRKYRDCKADRKAAVEAATADLRSSFLTSIEEYLREFGESGYAS
jgi:hypothetical protein